MRTIGTCENCEFWRMSANQRMECQQPKNQEDYEGKDQSGIIARNCEFAWLEPGSDFGCIHWQDKGRKPDHPNYPTKTPEQLRIETLERENDAAFEKIVKLSQALADFGIDPTQLPDDAGV